MVLDVRCCLLCCVRLRLRLQPRLQLRCRCFKLQPVVSGIAPGAAAAAGVPARNRTAHLLPFTRRCDPPPRCRTAPSSQSPSAAAENAVGSAWSPPFWCWHVLRNKGHLLTLTRACAVRAPEDPLIDSRPRVSPTSRRPRPRRQEPRQALSPAAGRTQTTLPPTSLHVRARAALDLSHLPQPQTQHN